MAEPIPDDDLEALLAPLLRDSSGQPRRVTLAVSGGSDSTALMVLVSRWRDACGWRTAPFDVAVVDHRLRLGSTGEAVQVADAARRLGFPSTVLTWTDPVARGVQQAARVARYDLLRRHVQATGGEAIVTGHTRNDQAETLLMRLARGSGVDGLSAMQPETEIDGLGVLRPLLGVAKARLVATVSAAGIGWIEDPSNESRSFERVRVRGSQPVLAELGLTSEALAAAARRLGRSRRALDWMADRVLADRAVVTVSPVGYARVDRAGLAAWPEDIRLRVLLRLLAAVGGRTPVPLAAAEALADAAFAEDFRGRTLSGCLVAPHGPAARVIVRESGRRRALPAPVQLGPGVVYDHRFDVRLAEGAVTGRLEVAAAGVDGARLARALGAGDPAAALRTMPGLFRDGVLVALPALDDPAARRLGCHAVFRGLELQAAAG